jgi:hypothetical protein
LIKGACAHHTCTLEGLVVLQDHTNRDCGVAATVYRREQGPRRFGRKLDSEDSVEWSWRGLPKRTPETDLRVGKTRGYPRSYPTGSLALARDSLRGAPSRISGKLKRFSIPCISIILFTFRIYTPYLGCVLYFPSLVDMIDT